MSSSLSPRAAGLLTLAGSGLIAALASGAAELAALAAPLLLLVSVGLALAREPRLAVAIEPGATRLLEGQASPVAVTLRNDGARGVELELQLASSAQIALEPRGAILLRLAPGAETRLEVSVRPQRWGVHRIGPLLVRARDQLGVREWSGCLGDGATLRAFPREERLRTLVAPRRTPPFLGAHVSRGRDDGIEFADIRPFAVGDRARQINWRATARRATPYVTVRHPEQTGDVVLLLDTFAEARGRAGGTLDAGVRAAASLARAHLARRDRVALVDFGGTLHWLEPAFGTRQLYRIIDALLASEIAFSYAWRAVESIPARLLPPTAVVLAITPLLDERSLRLLTDLRARGADVAVIEISPLALVAPGPTASDALAHRLWRLQREALRARLQALGIAVAVWEQTREPLAGALEEVNAFRRFTRPAPRV